MNTAKVQPEAVSFIGLPERSVGEELLIGAAPLPRPTPVSGEPGAHPTVQAAPQVGEDPLQKAVV